MGIMKRMFRIWKADLHGIIDQLEDKELLLKQHLRDMENNLQQKQARCDHLLDSRHQIERDILHCRERIDKVEKDVDAAVGKEKDDIARILIRKRKGLQANCDQLQQQAGSLAETHKKLCDVLSRQQLQYEQLKIQADAFFRESKTCQFHKNTMDLEGLVEGYAPTEEEVELELVKRKEALAHGGAS